MAFTKINPIGPAVTAVILVLGLLWLGWELTSVREEKDLIETGKCTKPQRVQPCLVLEFSTWTEKRFDGDVFPEGKCSFGSVAHYCQICGYNLSKEGRRKLMKMMLEHDYGNKSFGEDWK